VKDKHFNKLLIHRVTEGAESELRNSRRVGSRATLLKKRMITKGQNSEHPGSRTSRLLYVNVVWRVSIVRVS